MRRLILFLLFLPICAWSYDLRQSTAVTLQIGPYLDATDGVTPETGLGLADDIEISKNGGVFATVSSASLTYDSDGYYRWDATASETSDLGSLVVKSVSSTVHVPVWHEFMVLPSNVWDSLYSTDKLQVDVTQVSGTSEDIATETNVTANGTAIGNLNDFDPTTDEVDIGEVKGVAVTGVADFKATGFSTFDNTSDQVIVATNNDKTGYTLTGSYLTETETNSLIERATGDIITSIGSLSIPTVNQIVGGIWAEALPGSFNSGEAGYILGTNLDATVSSRSSHSAANVWASGTRTLTDPNSYKADVSSLAIEANVETHVTNSLGAYDPPTKNELDAGFLAAEATPEANLVNTAKLLSTSAAIELDGSVYRFTTNTLEQSPAGAVSDVSTTVGWIRDVLEGDVRSDTSGNYVVSTYVKGGTATLLIRKYLYDENGNPITNDTTAIASQLETAP